MEAPFESLSKNPLQNELNNIALNLVHSIGLFRLGQLEWAMRFKLSKNQLILGILAAIQFIHVVDFMVILPLGPQLMRVLDIDARHFSFLVSAYAVSAGISGFIASFFLDRLERKVTLLYVMAGFLMGTLACAFSLHYPMLLLARVLTGAFGGILSALIFAVLGDVVPANKRGMATGVVMISFSLSSVFGVPLGLFLANIWSWETPFFFLAGFGFIVWLIGWWTIPILRHHIPSAGERVEYAITSISKDTNLQRALSLTLVIMIGQFTVIPLISLFMVGNVGFSESQLMYIYMLGGACTIVTSALAGRLADKYGFIRMFTIFSVLVLFPLFGMTHLTRQAIWFPLIVTSFLFIFSNARMVCGMSLILSSVQPRNRAGFMSINSCIQQISIGLASFIGGLIVTTLPNGELLHYDRVGFLAMCTSLLAIIVAWGIRKTH